MKTKDLLQGISFIEEYKCEKINDKKSITIRLRIGSLKITLTTKKMDKCANAVIKDLNKTFEHNFDILL